jgi:hypothetical protein
MLLKFFPVVVEKFYSTCVYTWIAIVQRTITGWLPFSLGDILYAIAGLYLVMKAYHIIKLLIQRKASKQWLKRAVGSAIRFVLWIYIVFNVLWGINYSRQGIGHQLGIQPVQYNKEEVEALVCTLVDKVNAARKVIPEDSLKSMRYHDIYEEAALAYDTTSKQWPFLNYTMPSAKKSMYSSVSHYIGFSGYYNPFSGEAQVSTDLPNILVPYIACHEMAHQLGYASESEANFVGYLACSKSKNPYFIYSVYMDLYKYAATELFFKDFYTSHGWELDSLVRKDFLRIRRFFNKRSNRVSPVMSSMYNQYLKANNQQRGIESYNDVVGLLIAYQRKYGKI